MSEAVSSPRLSVLMPCFNVGDTVASAASSILEGVFSALELICVDDGSTDDTARRLETIAGRDDRVVVVRSPHVGLVAALNLGLERCTAPYIARMDADDWSHPDRLQRQLDHLEAHPELSLVSCGVEIVREDGSGPLDGMARYAAWVNALRSPEEISRARFIESPIPHPTVLARRAVFEGGYRQGQLPEDYELWLRRLAEGHRFAKLGAVLLRWADRDARATRTDPRYSLEAFRRLKIAWLMRGPLAGEEAVIVWGAGQSGKPWLRDLSAHGLRVPLVVELNPKKLGQRIHGALAVPPDALLARRSGRTILVCVGAPGARATIRSWMLERGLVEGEDWWAVC